MEQALPRYSWLGTVAATILCAWLAARIVNATAFGLISPHLSRISIPAAAHAPRLASIGLDQERVSALFGVPLEKPVPEGPIARGRGRPEGWNPDAVRSPLHA